MSFGHILTKGKLTRYDGPAVNDVKVTSCFLGFGQKLRFCGKHCHAYRFKDRTVQFTTKDEEWTFFQIAVSDFQSFERFGNLET